MTWRPAGGPGPPSPGGCVRSPGSTGTPSRKNCSSTLRLPMSGGPVWTMSRTRPGWTATSLAPLLVAAGLGPPGEHSLVSLLALNGLRVSEATGADIRGPGRGARPPDACDYPQGRQGRHHPAGAAHRPGDRPGRRRAVGRAGFLAADRRRLDRHGAARIVRRVALRAGISKPVGPTRCGTRSSPPPSTPGSRSATSRKPPRTLIQGPR